MHYFTTISGRNFPIKIFKSLAILIPFTITSIGSTIIFIPIYIILSIFNLHVILLRRALFLVLITSSIASLASLSWILSRISKSLNT